MGGKGRGRVRTGMGGGKWREGTGWGNPI